MSVASVEEDGMLRIGVQVKFDSSRLETPRVHRQMGLLSEHHVLVWCYGLPFCATTTEGQHDLRFSRLNE